MEQAEHVKPIYQKGVLAVQIKLARKERKLSQQDLANLAQLPKSIIGRIEAGITSFKVSTLLQISKALGTFNNLKRRSLKAYQRRRI